jgi:hypothetical protein
VSEEVLKELLDPDEAAHWQQVLEADAKKQGEECQRGGGDIEFSAAYNALSKPKPGRK